MRFSLSKRKVSLPMYELMFQTYNWEICNCTTQAGCNSSVENGKTSSKCKYYNCWVCARGGWRGKENVQCKEKKM